MNPYDVRKPCVGGDTCYEELNWVDTFMNNATVKAQLGVDPARNFTGGSAVVYLSFRASGDGMRNSAPLLTDLVNDGIRLLVYAGNAGTFSRGGRQVGAFIELNDSQTAFATTSATSAGWKNSKACSKENFWRENPFPGSQKTRKRSLVA